MDGVAETGLVEQGRDAAATGDWPRAFGLLVRADQSTRLTVDDLGLLAEVAYAAGHLDVTIEAWERAHAEAVRAGDSLAAADAASRVALHLLMDTALMAPIRGWVKASGATARGVDETPAHAWLAVIKSYDRLMMGDLRAAREWATSCDRDGIDRQPGGGRHRPGGRGACGDPGGRGRRGLDLVEEAAVATISGELDATSTGMVYCELVCMLQGLGQYDLAEEWTEAMERWSRGSGIGSVHGRCRVHRAEILRLRGANAEAEQEAMAACAELRPYLRREFGWPLTELGRIRLQLGDLARCGGGVPRGSRSRVGSGAGTRPGATGSGRRCLGGGIHPRRARPSADRPVQGAAAEHRPAPGSAARRAGRDRRGRRRPRRCPRRGRRTRPGGRSRSRAGRWLPVRRWQTDGCGSQQATWRVPGMAFETAVQLWSLVGAPHEVALARTGLAQAHRAAGAEVDARPGSGPTAVAGGNAAGR